MHFLFHTLRETLHIFRKGSPFGKWRMLLTYLELKATHAFVFKLLRIHPTGARVFGHVVYFYHLPTFIELFERVFIEGEYATPIKRPFKTILDCGANIGDTALYFYLLYPDAHITSFEPSSDTFEVLQKNLPYPERVTLVNKALGKSEGQLPFYFDARTKGMGTNSLVQERLRAGAEVEMVDCTPLSPYITQEVDFLKLDIEGAEQEVLEELAESGKLRMIREMIVEYHHHARPQEDRLSKFLAILEQNGFGYQLKDFGSGSSKPPVVQDILLYAYRKD
jgi:FkbM family methyltransferase